MSNLENSKNFQFEKLKKIPIREIPKMSNLENSENCQFRKFQTFSNSKIPKKSDLKNFLFGKFPKKF